MTRDEFRRRIEALGFSQSSLARRMIELGDSRTFAAVLRSVSNYATGVTGVPGEIGVILTLLERDPGARISVAPVRGPGRPRRLRSA
jgi:hypothetical protein